MCSLYVCSLIDASRNVQGREEVFANVSKMCQWALAQKRTHGGALERCHGAPLEPLAQRSDALGGESAIAVVVEAAERIATEPTRRRSTMLMGADKRACE